MQPTLPLNIGLFTIYIIVCSITLTAVVAIFLIRLVEASPFLNKWPRDPCLSQGRDAQLSVTWVVLSFLSLLLKGFIVSIYMVLCIPWWTYLVQYLDSQPCLLMLQGVLSCSITTSYCTWFTVLTLVVDYHFYRLMWPSARCISSIIIVHQAL